MFREIQHQRFRRLSWALSLITVACACTLGFDDDGGEEASEETDTSGADATSGSMTDTGDDTGTDGPGTDTSTDEGGNPSCGPATATVTKVLDGDTIEISGGERVRYILVDTPEFGNVNDCFAEEARDFNNMMVNGQTIELTYDQECRDQYDRLLAFVSVNGQDVNRLLVSEGYACVLHFPPNGDSQVVEYYSLLNEAFMEGKGMWGACDEPC